MTDLSKNRPESKPRFGSDWDVDLGWVLIWWAVFVTILGIVASFTYTSVKNNQGNVSRDKYYADKCEIISRTADGPSSTVVYRCQDK